MLGNQYFMARNFREAIHHFEKASKKHPDDLQLAQKYVICLAVNEQVDAAASEFLRILRCCPSVILTSQNLDPDCPCPEILAKWSLEPPARFDRFHYLTALGILAVFCKRELALAYFCKAREIKPTNAAVREIVEIISTEIDSVARSRGSAFL